MDRPRRHAPDGVVWHRLDDLEPTHVHLRDGLRVTTPARTVVDLAVASATADWVMWSRTPSSRDSSTSRRSGLPSPTHEHPLPSVQCLDGFVDRCFAGAHLIVEADGRKWHERRRNLARDAERDLEAARGGFQTVRMMWEHLTSDPQGMAASVVDSHRVRLHG